MPTLLLRLCGPMQSWGTRSRFVERDTELEPSKSGVLGIVCAAAGIPRDQPIPADWLALRFGVRCDRPGSLSNDYHTAGGDGSGVARSDGGHSNNAVLSNRNYLADADFLIGLEGEDLATLQAIEAAIRAPRWQIFLGRKSFVPSLPLHRPGGGIREGSLLEVLRAEEYPLRPVFAGRAASRDRVPVRFVAECLPGESNETRQDQPRPDSFARREFDQRWVITSFEALPEQVHG